MGPAGFLCEAYDHMRKPGITAQPFLERLFGDLSGMIASEEALRRQWSTPDRRERFIAPLEQRGYVADKLAETHRLIDAPNSDPFDVLAHVRFTTQPKTRADHAESARSDGLPTGEGQVQEFLLGVLNACEAQGEAELATA